jgi:hypothetical protein
MRKTSKQTTSTTGAAAGATAPAVAHEHFPSPHVTDNFVPSSWPWGPDDFSPIEWWRSLPADHLGDAQQLMLRATLDKICVMNGREWLSAMHGDAAASIAIAVEMFPITEVTLEVDLAMTVLMFGALDGNAAAAVVLSQLLGRAPLDHPFAKELSVSWLVLNLRRALNASKLSNKAGADSKASSNLSIGTAPSLVGSPA